MSDFRFSLKSTPDMIDFDGSNFKFWKRVLLEDSILNFYPQAEIFVPDYVGELNEYNFFTESLDLTCKFGNDEIGHIEHDFYWNASQLNQALIDANHISGDFIFIITSNFKTQDSVKSKSWKNNISAIVKEVMQSYNFPANTYNKRNKDLHITETNSNDIWYQANITDKKLFEFLEEKAISKKGKQLSPFTSFINLKGEFYFTSIEDLYAQEPVDFYTLTNDPYRATDYDRIIDHELIFGGAGINLNNYNKTYYSINDSGEYIKQTNIKISDYVHHADSKNNDKITIRKQYLDNVRAINYYGLSGESDSNNLKGSINQGFLNSLFSYRMKIVVNYHPESVAGRIIETQIDSADSERKMIAHEYSGKWIIIKSKHFIDSTGIPNTELLLGKPAIVIEKDHSFYPDFIA